MICDVILKHTGPVSTEMSTTSRISKTVEKKNMVLIAYMYSAWISGDYMSLLVPS